MLRLQLLYWEDLHFISFKTEYFIRQKEGFRRTVDQTISWITSSPFCQTHPPASCLGEETKWLIASVVLKAPMLWNVLLSDCWNVLTAGGVAALCESISSRRTIPNFRITWNWLESFHRACRSEGSRAGWLERFIIVWQSAPKNKRRPRRRALIRGLSLMRRRTERCVQIPQPPNNRSGCTVRCLKEALWSEICVSAGTSVRLINGRFKKRYFSVKCWFNPIRVRVMNTDSLCYFQDHIVITAYCAPIRLSVHILSLKSHSSHLGAKFRVGRCVGRAMLKTF